MLDLDPLHDALNYGNSQRVGEALSEWHPAILGELLQAIAIAKKKRYPGRHGDYDKGLQAAQRAA